MENTKNFSWMIVFSCVLHAAFAAFLLFTPKVERRSLGPKTVTMHVASASRKVAAAPEAPAPEVKPPTPKPEPVRPQSKPKPKPKVVKPKPAAVAQAKLEPKPVEPPVTPPKKQDPAPPPQLAMAKEEESGNENESQDDNSSEGEDENEGGDSEADRFPVLLQATLKKPRYTEEALFAGLEGLFVIDVQIDHTGKVLDVRMKKKVGYGMDTLILAAVHKARFRPGHDKSGKALAGWTKIQFKLEIPK